jgi:glycosyltransferase involved in cell wall biosynthesis
MITDPTIDILLATFNGEQYLSDQINSILNQTYANWRLIIRDDGSKDRTAAIIDDFKCRYPDKITVINDDRGNLGACRNFAALLERTEADYIMFCDQDDIWLPRKIETTYRKMYEMINRYTSRLPLLVYTDMKIVDQDTKVVADSYWKYQAFNPESGKVLNRLLVSNVIIGCTVMINKALRDLSIPFSDNTLMHDWWAGLVSVTLGKNDYLEEATVLYRQHESNVVGATRKMNFRSVINKIKDMKKHREFLLHSQIQACDFARKYRQLLSVSTLGKIRTYAALSSQNWIKRRYITIKNGFWWSGLVRNITMMIIL